MIDAISPAFSLLPDLVLTTEAQRTERALTALIALLLVIAAMLALLTFWYWRHTNPRRRMRHVFADVEAGDHNYDFDLEAGHDHDQMIDLGGTYEDARQADYR